MIHPTTKKWSRIVFAPAIWFFNFLSEYNPKLLMQIRYFLLFHKLPNLKDPQNLNEKILYLKLFTDTSEWTDLTDKYKVRAFVEERGLGDCLVPLLAIWKAPEDFDLEPLPNSFIMKANNGGGNTSVKIVKDKSSLTKNDIIELREMTEKWLQTNYKRNPAAEPQIRNIIPCVVVEELLPLENGQKSLVDYKFWCFNGTPYYVFVVSNRDGVDAYTLTYDIDWHAHPEFSVPLNNFKLAQAMEKPKNYEKMINVAKILADGFPCVRVDLYNIEGKIYFGEMTFTSQAGLMDYFTDDFLQHAGSLISFDKVNKL